MSMKKVITALSDAFIDKDDADPTKKAEFRPNGWGFIAIGLTMLLAGKVKDEIDEEEESE